MDKQIVPDAMVSINVDSAGNMSITPVRDEPAVVDTTGIIRLEEHAMCLAVINQEDNKGCPRKRLERIKDINVFEMVSRRNWDKVVIATIDDKGRLYMSRKGFDSMYDAQASLEGKLGSWVIVSLTSTGRRVLPSAKYTDPFSLEIPIKDSYFAANGNNLFGCFIKPGDIFVNWIFTHNPGGFFIIPILERCELFDRGIASITQDSDFPRCGDAKIGDYHVYEKFDDGTTRLLFISSQIEAARSFINNRNGLLLLAKWVDFVDTH